jgi:hypothetical protein
VSKLDIPLLDMARKMRAEDPDYYGVVVEIRGVAQVDVRKSSFRWVAKASGVGVFLVSACLDYCRQRFHAKRGGRLTDARAAVRTIYHDLAPQIDVASRAYSAR